MTCPKGNVDLFRLPSPPAGQVFPLVKCQVCSVSDVSIDHDSREGFFQGSFYFGQNSIGKEFAEEYVKEYKVYIVDSVRAQLGDAVAVVPRRDVPEKTCCQWDAYEAK
ncbi:unnamed protein product, partial [Polarella glacialis]